MCVKNKGMDYRKGGDPNGNRRAWLVKNKKWSEDWSKRGNDKEEKNPNCVNKDYSLISF